MHSILAQRQSEPKKKPDFRKKVGSLVQDKDARDKLLKELDIKDE